MKRPMIVASLGLAGVLLGLPHVDWPGGSAMHTADQVGVLGGNLSGLTVAAKDSLWAIRDEGQLLRLDRSGTGWVPSAGWGKGRTLHYPNGAGTPDSEAVTTVAAESGVVFVGAERNNDDPKTSHNAVLRFDTSGTGPMVATQEWPLGSVLPPSAANSGIEGLTWIPDQVFVDMGFKDAAGKTYVPSDYPDHGTGLFVVGLEQDGSLTVVALGDTGGVSLISSFPSGQKSVMEVTWSTERNELWALCDNTCGGQIVVFRPSDGSFKPLATLQPPQGMSAINDEGFVFATSCTNGTMTAVWADDSATDGHALREANVACETTAGTDKRPNSTSTVAVATSGVVTAKTTAPPTAATPAQPTPVTTPVTTTPQAQKTSSGTARYVMGTAALAAAAATAFGVRRSRKRR